MLVLNHFAVPRDGAGGTRHVELFGRLEGWEATIIAADRNLFDRRRYRSDEIVTVPTTPYRTNGIFRVLNWISYGIAAMLRGLAVPKPDVVYASSPHLLAGLAGWVLARIRRCPFVFEVRDLWPDLLVSMGQLEESSTLFRVLERLEVFLYRRADRVVVLAEGAVDAVASKGIETAKIVFLPNAADPEDFEILEERARLRAEFGLEGRVFVYAGAHGPANGLDLLLEAARQAHDEFPEVEFLLIGDGPAKASLIEMAEASGLKNVTFRDPIPKSAIPRLLAACDVGVHVLRDVPIFRYGVSPNKLCDYLAAGLPALTNSPGESGDLVTASGGGVAVEPNELAEGVRQLARLGDTELRELGRCAREYMTEHRSRTAVAGDLGSMLEELSTTTRRTGALRTVAKRLVDVVGAGVALALTLPVQLVVALVVRVSVGSPVLFRQARPGRNGEPIQVLKFRTMTDERDADGELLPDHARLTPVGTLLRRTSLDELPELWNVLRGDMSLVGPRPLLTEYLDRYTPEQARRHEVKPGITGLAQVSGRNALDWEERLALDVWYVDNWSLRLDFKILARTVGQVLGRKGINAPGHATMPEFQGSGGEVS